jgi:hypothetical protein
MLYIDYSQVKAMQVARQIELGRSIEKNQLSRNSKQDNYSITGAALESLGNGLIWMGERLKGTGNSYSPMKVATSDCD